MRSRVEKCDLLGWTPSIGLFEFETKDINKRYNKAMIYPNIIKDKQWDSLEKQQIEKGVNTEDIREVEPLGS